MNTNPDEWLKQYGPIFHQQFTLEVGKGWIPIVKDMLHDLQVFCANNPKHNLNISQIKEKFGELRVYYSVRRDTPEGKISWNNPEISQIILRAIERCTIICERCGDRGEMKAHRTFIICNKCDAEFSSGSDA